MPATDPRKSRSKPVPARGRQDWRARSRSSLVRYVSRVVRSVLSDEKKLSIAASSQTLLYRLIEQTTP